MADKAISELVSAEQITATDMFVLEQNGTAKKLTGQALLNWLTAAADGHGGIQSYALLKTEGLVKTYRFTLADQSYMDIQVTDGRGISSITKTGTSGLVDTYRISYTDGTSSTFTVANGAKGDKGDNSYLWIKYASQEPTAGSHSFGDLPDDWIGVYWGTSATAPTYWQQYKWFKIKGEKGVTGEPARLTSSSVEYQVSDSGTVIPSGAWSSSVPVVAQGKYLWTRITQNFNTGSLVCLYVLAMQVFGITEIRQNLIYSHILLIVTILSIPSAALFNKIVYKSWGIRRSWRLMTLLFVGIGLDLLFYYLNNGTGLMSFSIISFIIYMLIVFLKNVQESSRKVYTDSRTGLDNRTRWNELMNSETPLPEPYAIMVVDLNGLKQINDTLGHEAGDHMIFELSSILRNTLPRSSVICRWGGDEFAIMLTGINRTRLDSLVQSLVAAGKAYNTDYPELPIHFAVGTALSEEHPHISCNDLFRLADEDMYRNKQLWYAKKVNV